MPNLWVGEWRGLEDALLAGTRACGTVMRTDKAHAPQLRAQEMVLTRHILFTLSRNSVFLVVLALTAAAQQQAKRNVSNMPPVVVKTVPTAGDTRVDPATSEIRVTFSKDMTDGCWSFVQMDGGTFPKIAGDIKFLADKRTCVCPVKLEPGTAYVVWINSDRYKNFKDKGLRTAVPYLLVFETR